MARNFSLSYHDGNKMHERQIDKGLLGCAMRECALVSTTDTNSGTEGKRRRELIYHRDNKQHQSPTPVSATVALRNQNFA